VFPFLTGEKISGIMEAWGRKGRPALEAYLYPELFALFAVSFFLIFLMSFLLRLTNAAPTRLNLLPGLGFIAAVLENVCLLLLANSWPAKDTRGFAIPGAVVFHGIKVVCFGIAFLVLTLAVVYGFKELLQEAGLQGASAPGGSQEKAAAGTPAKRRKAN
jgi:hypothetical protein